MRKRDLVDGLVGPRTIEAMDQMLCMKGMTNAEKVDFLMSRNRELRAENAKLQAEMTELEGTIECLKGLAEANYERCDTCEAMLDCDECLRADASHKELRGLQAENRRLRELVRCLVNAEHPSDRATLIANAADMLAEHEKDVDYLCDMCANGCDERRTIRVGQSAYDVCEKWQEVEE